ncbi:MAG TPA: GH3 auxin-responsive promoter family protein, partial [Cyclobacteriaceae bacterium]|nr:GH3 auxin-responsive promoter family protein [Cyclobacteriaceae bacterium]
EVVEFTVAPQVTPKDGLPHHEWLVEFANPPRDKRNFIETLDKHLRELNVYYDDLISGSILRPLELTTLKRNAFIDYMKGVGKLGGQNKVPRLSNDRRIADVLGGFAQ